MRQVNIVGPSPVSAPSRVIQTLQAPPDMAPSSVTVRTASETSLWLRWVVSGIVVKNLGCRLHPQKGIYHHSLSYSIIVVSLSKQLNLRLLQRAV